jgi:hypothetical protein
MKKIGVFVIVAMLTLFASVAMADHRGEGKVGRLFLFQKCDDSLIGTEGYDALGCPAIGTGPWPVFHENRRMGKMDYVLWGKEFKFSFQGNRLLPKEDYTLIYYPDPWPGTGLICLGSNHTNRAGNIQIHGSEDIGTSLPASYDANFNPISPSGAVGAKIWLVLSADVQCGNESKMLNWNPIAYLFENNLIVYEFLETDDNEDDEE